MGVEPFLVSSALNLILAQRLARRVCQECKEELHLPEKALDEVGFDVEDIPEIKLFEGKGCSICRKPDTLGVSPSLR